MKKKPRFSLKVCSLICLPLVVLGIEVIALQVNAIEPTNPEAMCDRFIKPVDRSTCQAKARKMDLDWYAASVCNLVEDDDQLIECWKRIDGKAYSPTDLASCADVEENKDEERIQCLVRISRKDLKKNRLPASSGEKSPGVYQKKEK